LERFRSLLLEEAALQVGLAEADDWAGFVPRAIAAARRLGLDLTAEAFAPLQRADPIGVSRFTAPPSPAPRSLAPGWLPAQVAWDGAGYVVDWLHFGDRRLDASFFEGDVREALNRPINALCRFRTPLAAVGALAPPGARPSGLIFHMSRCGSTLLARMLAASAANVVLSEAAPLDVALQLALAGARQADPSAPLREVASALGQARHGARRCFVKLEAWHALALPVFQRAFPDTPWIFVCREPREVLVSHRAAPAARLAPEPWLSNLVGDAGAATPEQRCAAFLAATCEAALDAAAAGGGLVLDYAELPQALWTHVLPHFSVDVSAADRAAMARAGGFDAKAPWLAFSSDVEAKRGGVDARIREACAGRLDAAYAALGALGRAQASLGADPPRS
jgi:hypothetical protein